MRDDLTIRAIAAPELPAYLDELADLRIRVFREWPYLYDGDSAYERDYLSAYIGNEGAFVAGVFETGRLVGACTASPLTAHHDDFAKPFAAADLALSDYFYFGESVLLPQWRGRGIGGRFFDLREAEAIRQGYETCVFCAVRRSDDHPMRPAGYRPLNGFWRKRGYQPMAGIEAAFSWKDIGEPSQTSKPMDFWVRSLRSGQPTSA